MRYSVFIAMTCLASMFAGCRDVPVVDLPSNNGDTLKEHMINANRHIANSEALQIAEYAHRRGWEMTPLSGGTWLLEVKAGHGVRVEFDDTVSIRYRMEALNGTVLYAEKEETVLPGRLQPTRGLAVGLLALREGSRACVIVPSEQGYGVAGDGNAVKSRLVLVYDVEVLTVNKQKK